MALQPFDQGMLKLDMPLALGDVIVHHLEVGRAVGHGSKITRTAVSVARNSGGCSSKRLGFGPAGVASARTAVKFAPIARN